MFGKSKKNGVRLTKAGGYYTGQAAWDFAGHAGLLPEIGMKLKTFANEPDHFLFGFVRKVIDRPAVIVLSVGQKKVMLYASHHELPFNAETIELAQSQFTEAFFPAANLPSVNWEKKRTEASE